MTVTTIKIKKDTKSRLDKLREYERESYEDLIKKVLGILNVLKADHSKARSILSNINIKRLQLNASKRYTKEQKEPSI